MSDRKISAKEKAFEKERIAYRQKIRQLESTVSSLEAELAKVKGEVTIRTNFVEMPINQGFYTLQSY